MAFEYFCRMKVLIDDKIPYIKGAAEWLFDEVSYLPGNAFAGSSEIAEADALIVRTRTHCDAALVRGTRVQFIATATIGHDHIDKAQLEALGIAWTNCPGCNAGSVAQYIRNSILLIAQQRCIEPSALCVGIVGYGHVGRQVRLALEAIGCPTLLNDPPLVSSFNINGAGATCDMLDDPPLAARGAAPEQFVELADIARRCDVITLHTPLTTEGKWQTMHLIGEPFFAQTMRQPVIINAARGGVIDEAALLRAKAERKVSDLVIDTWEGEPDINKELLDTAFIATPHIAGYSADGKSNATRMALLAVCNHFGINIPDETHFLALTAPPALPVGTKPCGDPARDALTLYNPLADTLRLKSNPADFEAQRGNYPLRREQF